MLIKENEKEVKEEILEEVKTEKKTVKKTKTAKDKITPENLDKYIAEWKAMYGKIYKNVIDDNEFVIWRLIKRKEYKELLDNDSLEIFDKQESIVKAALLYPENVDELIESRAGLATVLAEEILEHSGFEISKSERL